MRLVSLGSCRLCQGSKASVTRALVGPAVVFSSNIMYSGDDSIILNPGGYRPWVPVRVVLHCEMLPMMRGVGLKSIREMKPAASGNLRAKPELTTVQREKLFISGTRAVSARQCCWSLIHFKYHFSKHRQDLQISTGKFTFRRLWSIRP